MDARILERICGRHGELRLAGISVAVLHGKTVAVLHGKTVVLVLAHQRTLIAEGGHVKEGVVHPVVDGPITEYVSEPLSRAQLGHATGCPVLAVRLETPDRPGAIVAMLNALSEELEHMTSRDIAGSKWKVWYANVAASDIGTVRLTVRLEIDAEATPAADPIADWDPAQFAGLERLALERAGTRFQESQEDQTGEQHERRRRTGLGTARQHQDQGKADHGAQGRSE
ncbi:MAG TPA: hypothetical protein VMR14_03090 [Streptosporangiaceae bacterium]|nr:hypothetical protein [Streptosporangiaceae bacterium]